MVLFSYERCQKNGHGIETNKNNRPVDDGEVK